MPLIKIPSYYQPFTDFNTELDVNVSTVGEAMQVLIDTYPGLKPLIYTYWGILSPKIMSYLNEDEVFTLQGMDTPLKENDRILLVPTASGG
jgi:sulfur-carrier protein